MTTTNETKNISTGFGTAPVFFTAISTILGAILFLRFGFAVGTVGFWGVFLIIILGHFVTVPTALAISEIATNQRVEGGGEYFIISRSFGLNIGATIGIALYLSQAISVAFYIIAFTEAFSPLFEFFKTSYGWELPRQIISIPAMAILALIVIKKGADIGVKTLYIVVFILFLSLLLFFLGTTDFVRASGEGILSGTLRNPDQFFIVFAICFPAFTGMTAGVGLSGDLRDPKKSIPVGTISATIVGMIIYFFVIWKLSVSASPENLINDQLIMSKIAVAGWIMIPLGLAASTFSSAIGSILVAPRTLQAICLDESLPFKSLNNFLKKGKGKSNEPVNATIITSLIAFIFIGLGNVNAVASIISMFFMVTYGAICLISFLHHFGSDPSYRPTFKSRWYVSLMGFILCVWLMVQMDLIYALFAISIMILLYFYITSNHKERAGLASIFQQAIFQLSRRFQIFIQKTKAPKENNVNWRPSAVCISSSSFERDKAFTLLKWISYKFGFGTYIHFNQGYYSKEKQAEAKKQREKLLERVHRTHSNFYVDTIISPSYTSAIAQTIQLPGPSGMENNLIFFEYNKHNPENIKQIIENLALVQAGEFDVGILGASSRSILYENGIHVWIRDLDTKNVGLMIMLSYIILGHPDWKDGFIKINSICKEGEYDKTMKKIKEFVLNGRLPITDKNMQVFELTEKKTFKNLVNNNSSEAGFVIIGMQKEQLKKEGEKVFDGYEQIGDVLFVNAFDEVNID